MAEIEDDPPPSGHNDPEGDLQAEAERDTILRMTEDDILKELSKLSLADILLKLKLGQCDYRDHAVIAKILKDRGYALPVKSDEEEQQDEQRSPASLPTYLPDDTE
ncbi:hypothetical protein [Taklimakanibacter albus]|uniref:Uncharacterized protein n=1 Tax=Taklimakanibacter albus TaxID=2800327 RepID=A0ACC5RFZ9_9HYPH|nr:hypothetical protein [Aestuariivirga sp. YIM B02566]MBK1871580.1 hypothetical protein [Aestuariivirga sp. YIM B02566]